MRIKAVISLNFKTTGSYSLEIHLISLKNIL